MNAGYENARCWTAPRRLSARLVVAVAHESFLQAKHAVRKRSPRVGPKHLGGFRNDILST